MLLSILLIMPLLGAFLLSLIGAKSIAAYVNALISFLTCAAAVGLLYQVVELGPFTTAGEWFYLDHFNLYLLLLTTFIGFTTSLFCIRYFQKEILLEKLKQKKLRIFYSQYQFFIFTMLLVLTTNNLGILWVAMEGATFATVLLVSLYRTPAGIEAAWKYLILCGVGLAQALLGTVLLYFAARNILNAHDALLLTHLKYIGHALSPHIASLAFIFILVGYGTKAGLVPLHNWLPDAHGEGPAPISALLSGLLLNIAVYAIIRCQTIIEKATESAFTHHLLLLFGLLNVLVAAFFLLRQKEVKRLYAYSSIEHIGLIIFAFGLDTPLAFFAALFHMGVHSLSKTAAFFSAGQAMQYRKTHVIANINGLIQDHPKLGWGLLLSSLALMGMPPFGTFVSEFLILFVSIQYYPWLALLLLIGLLIAFAGLFYKIQGMVFSESTLMPTQKVTFSLVPLYLHLCLIVLLGLWVPFYLTDWFNQIIKQIF